MHSCGSMHRPFVLSPETAVTRYSFPATRILALALAALPVALDAQARPTTRPATGARPVALNVAPMAAPFDTLALGATRWREIGPYRGGRSVAVAGSVARPKEYWMGTVGS